MKLTNRTLRLTFDKDSPYAGAEAVLRLSVTFGEFTFIERTLDEHNIVSPRCVSLLLNLVLEWNLTDDDDQPIPITPEGFDKVPDIGFFAVLLAQWRKVVLREVVPDVPLERR